jgi:hypothetical protein
MPISRASVTAFLNTGLGLWLLSTVAVGLISFGYGQLNAHLTERNKKSAQIARLHIEVLQRWIQFNGHFKQIAGRSGFVTTTPNSDVSAATISLFMPPSALKGAKYPIYAAFDDYKERPIVSLLVEIAFLLERKQRGKLTPNLEEVTSLTPEKIRSTSPADIEKIFEEMFDSEYWRKAAAEEEF